MIKIKKNIKIIQIEWAEYPLCSISSDASWIKKNKKINNNKTIKNWERRVTIMFEIFRR